MPLTPVDPAHIERGNQRHQRAINSIMPKLSDTQLVILSAAEIVRTERSCPAEIGPNQ